MSLQLNLLTATKIHDELDLKKGSVFLNKGEVLICVSFEAFEESVSYAGCHSAALALLPCNWRRRCSETHTHHKRFTEDTVIVS